MRRLLVLFCIIFICSCNNDNSAISGKKNPNSYEKTKETLGNKEKKNPIAFLSVNGRKKKNLIGQTVIKGKITNHASVVSYKDVEVQLLFYSKTRTLLEKDNEVIYEVFPPGGTKNFKTKYFAPKGTDSVGYEIISAKIN